MDLVFPVRGCILVMSRPWWRTVSLDFKPKTFKPQITGRISVCQQLSVLSAWIDDRLTPAAADALPNQTNVNWTFSDVSNIIIDTISSIKPQSELCPTGFVTQVVGSEMNHHFWFMSFRSRGRHACPCAVWGGGARRPGTSTPDQDSHLTHQHQHRLLQENSEG